MLLLLRITVMCTSCLS